MGGKAIFSGATYDSESNTWQKNSGFHWATYGTVVGNKAVYVGNYYRTNQPELAGVYDTSTGTWTYHRLTNPLLGRAATSAGDVALFAGGESVSDENPSDQVDLYNARTGNWSIAHLSDARTGIAAASVGKLAFFAGGSDAGGMTDIVDIYNAHTGKWSVAHLSQPGAYLYATAIGNKVLFGGTSNRVDVYDVTTGQWSTVPVPATDNAFAAVSVGNQAMFINNATSYLASNTVDQFVDPNVQLPASFLTGHFSHISIKEMVAARQKGFVSLAVTNQSSGTVSRPVVVRLYASLTSVINGSAVLLGTVRLKNAVAPGAQINLTVPIQIPRGLTPGSYNLLMSVGGISGTGQQVASKGGVLTIRSSARTAAG